MFLFLIVIKLFTLKINIMIQGFHYSRMRVNDLFAFNGEVKPLVDLLVNENDTVLPKIKQDLDNASDVFNEIVKKATAKYQTKEVSAGDVIRDSVGRGFVSNVESYLHSLDDQEVVAASKVIAVINEVGRFFYDEPLATQTVLVKKLISRLEAECADEITLLGLGRWISNLKKSNNDFEVLYETRKNIVDNLPNISATESGELLIKCYQQAFNYIDIIVDVMKNPVFISTAESINNIITKYNAIVKARSTRSANEQNTSVQVQE